jgi:DNA-binding CsgD family transcriptional regulator
MYGLAMFSSFPQPTNLPTSPVSRLSQYSNAAFYVAGDTSSVESEALSRPLLGSIGFKPEPLCSELSLDLLSRAILEQMPQGVAVLSPQGSPLYLNRLGHQICDRFTVTLEGISLWQSIVQALPQDCRRDLIVQDVQPVQGQVIRLQWMSVTVGDRRTVSDPAWLLLMEDRNARLLGEMRQEQQRYSLTEREAQIWVLLKLDHSYQDIAHQLGISLNTVKTHVKNVYVKRRNHTDAPVPILFP